MGGTYERNARKRMDIQFSLEEFYGGLNCGEGMEVKIDGKWYPTGIEYGDDWYLSSEKLRIAPFSQDTFHGKDKIVGLNVRITHF